jgi:hypothetical protein
MCAGVVVAQPGGAVATRLRSIFVVKPLSRHHALMKKSEDQYSFVAGTIEDHVPAMLETAQTGSNVPGDTAKVWIARRHLATVLEVSQITSCLV